MDLITIGIIGKAHGIKGDVIVHPMTFDENRFYDLTDVYLNSKPPKKLTIERIQAFKNGFRIKFVESIDRNFAESIRNKEIQIPESEKIELPEDVYFIHDLIGCEVFNQSENKIGEIVHIQEAPTYDLYVVKTNKKEVLIPAISKFIHHVDIDKKRVEINEIPGLLDL